MPRFTRELPNGQTLTLWVDYADRSLSEFNDAERFMAELMSFDGEYIETLSSNDWEDILSFITEYE